MKKQYRAGIDIMNRNTITSMAMATALWETENKDLIALVCPFVLYAVGETTRVGSIIDIDKVCSVMKAEFGYKSFPAAIVRRVFLREISSKREKPKTIEKKSGEFYLVRSLGESNNEFSRKRMKCKGRSDQVISALITYLNVKKACGRGNYTSEDAERELLRFIKAQGNSVLSSVDDLFQLRSRDNEMSYHISHFILSEYEKKSVIMDYLLELVKGYFVTTAIFLQAENANVTKAAFKEVTFYLDTRVLLAYLGYKSKQENESIQTMISSLRKNGAKLACFVYNTEEIKSILKAYRNTVLNDDRRATITLEYFDEHGGSYSIIEMAYKHFEDNLKIGGILPTRMDELLETVGASESSVGLLNDLRIKELLLKINPKYNLAALPDDIKAINTVSRIRRGEELPYIERSKAVFVTHNGALVAATKQYLDEERLNLGFPLAITVDDLCVIAWIKDFEQSGALPKMRLLENALAAMTPSKELLDSYFEWIDILEHENSISDEEASLLRVELFARQELMRLTCGNNDKLNATTIKKIRDKLSEESYERGRTNGLADAQREYDNMVREQRTRVCKKAEEEVSIRFERIEGIITCAIRALLVAITVLVIMASIVLYCSDKNVWAGILTVVSILGAIETSIAASRRKGVVLSLVSRILEKRKTIAADKKKEEYLTLLERE